MQYIGQKAETRPVGTTFSNPERTKHEPIIEFETSSGVRIIRPRHVVQWDEECGYRQLPQKLARWGQCPFEVSQVKQKPKLCSAKGHPQAVLIHFEGEKHPRAFSGGWFRKL